MEKTKANDKNIFYRIFNAIEFTAVFAMAAVFVIAGIINYI